MSPSLQVAGPRRDREAGPQVERSVRATYRSRSCRHIGHHPAAAIWNIACRAQRDIADISVHERGEERFVARPVPHVAKRLCANVANDQRARIIQAPTGCYPTIDVNTRIVGQHRAQIGFLALQILVSVNATAPLDRASDIEAAEIVRQLDFYLIVAKSKGLQERRGALHEIQVVFQRHAIYDDFCRRRSRGKCFPDFLKVLHDVAELCTDISSDLLT
jgi:hypothetical protein